MITARANATRDDLIRVVRARPFDPFALMMESGERIIVNHPENLAFDPEPDGSVRFRVISTKLVTDGTLDAISTITTLDRGQV